MAKILSELERFEQELKELGSEIAPLTGGISTSLPIPPPPRPLVPSVISAPPVASSSAQPPLLLPQISVRPPPPRPPAVQPIPTSPNSTATPWLLNPGGVSAPTNASTSSQFTYATSGVPFPPPQPSNVSSTSTTSASYFPVPIHLQQQQSSQYQPQPYMPYQPQVHQPAVVKTPQYTYQGVYQAPIATTDIFSLPQQQQAQQLFQRDAQTITPEALESVKAALASGDNEHKAEAKKKAIPRKAAGQAWEDPTLSDWPENDYRLFCGDLGNEVNDEVLTKAFSRYTSFTMARVVRDKRTGKTKGYGFVSFSTPSDLALALKEMNGKYVGNRPIKLRKSTWKERTDMEALSKHKNNKRIKTSKKNILHK